MDVTLYAIALAVFAVLYLAIGVFLAFTLIITLLILFAYLVIRYRDLPSNYPHSASDAITTMIFIGITWAIFTFVADKTPLPFIGTGLLYTNTAVVPMTTILAIGFVVAILFLCVFAFLAGRKDTQGTPAQNAGQEPPKQGVGAG
jgi:heme/copper-type cytochrome/quinol oxidase subunit 2